MKRAYFKYIFSLLLFGTNGIVASNISLNSYEIVLLRSLIGSVFLILVFGVTGGRLTFWKNKRQSVYCVISGIAMGASWMFLYEAYQQTSVSIASLAYYCGPVIVMVLSPVLFHERLTFAKVTGFLGVLCGIFLVNGQALAEGKTGWGILCGALSAVMYAVMVIFNKKARSIKGLENTMIQLVVGFITVASFVGMKQGFAMHIAKGEWGAILILGLLNTGMGCYLYFSSIGCLPVQSVAICGYIEPLSAVVFSVLFLSERMGPVQILGAVLILGGAVLGECGFKRKADIT